MGIIGKEEVSLPMTQIEYLSKQFAMFRTLKTMGVKANSAGVNELLIRKHTPDKVLRMAHASKIKVARYDEGRTIGTFIPRHQGLPSKKITPDDIFHVFFALITRRDPDIIRSGENALENAGLLRRGRDSISNSQRMALYEWIYATPGEKMKLWQYTMSPSHNAASLLLGKLRSEFNNCKAIREIVELLTDTRIQRRKVLLVVGGCSLNNLNVTAREVSCCYFFRGLNQNVLIQWVNSPDHIFLYLKRVGKAQHHYFGVAMLFFIEGGKTIVIDSVEAMRYEISSYSGWMEWLWNAVLEYGRSMGAERIIVNKDVVGDVAKEFATWAINDIREHEIFEFWQPYMSRKQFEVTAEFNPKIQRRCVARPL